MNFDINKIQFTRISKPHKETFLQLLKDNSIEVARKQITPIYKVQFQGKIYFNNFSDYATAKKLFNEAKNIVIENDKKEMELQRKLIQQK